MKQQTPDKISPNWRQLAFKVVMFGCSQFIVLTLIAMLIYPGGSVVDPRATKYRFFENFFSDLGLTVTHGDDPNTLSAVLFFVALSLVGLGLVLFFVALPGLFSGLGPAWILSLGGSFFGIISGLSFVGVAFTPANLLGQAHLTFVQLAFLAFLAAVLFYIPAMLLNPTYPRAYVVVFIAFGLILGGYVWLLFSGVGESSVQGLVIQVTGQKIVAYAAIISAFIQSYGALQLLEGHDPVPAGAI